MDAKKLLKLVERVRSANAARDRDLAEIQQTLEASMVPDPPRKRQNLKAARLERIERMYAGGVYKKQPIFKQAK